MSFEEKNGMSQEERDEIEAAKPEDTDFRQQRLRAWQPLLTPKWVISSFLIVGLVFLPIGIAILVTSGDVVELEQRYDHLGANSCEKCPISFTVEIQEDMKSPVYFYYKLTNFYQNHRRYVKSRSDEQLSGEGSDTSTCDPLERNEGKILYPCGLVASSHFNDVFNMTITRASGGPDTTLALNEKGIAWETDVKTKFKDQYKFGTPFPSDRLTRKNPRDGTDLPYLDDEHFIVWMRTAGLPTFKKLYAKIETDLKKKDLVHITVDSNFEVHGFDGTKSVVFSTAGWLGGKNMFLGNAYVIVGAICIFLGLAFLAKQVISPRTLGDMKYFKWAFPGSAPSVAVSRSDK